MPVSRPNPTPFPPVVGRVRVAPRRWVVLLMAAALAAAATACSHGSPSEPDTPVFDPTTSLPATITTTTATTTTTTTPPSPEEQAKAAYLEAMRTYFEVARDPDPADPRLAKYFADASLTRVREVLSDLQRSHLRANYRTPPVPEILTVQADSSDRVTIGACLIDSSHVVDTNGIAVDSDSTSTRVRVHLRRTGTQWHVNAQEDLSSAPGNAGCDS